VVSVSRSTLKALADCCHFLGSLWGAAGALKLIFGVRITFPLFPPIDLERVSPAPAIAIAVGLFVLGGWLGRKGRPTAERSGIELLEQPHHALFAASRVPMPPHSEARKPTPTASRSPSDRRNADPDEPSAEGGGSAVASPNGATDARHHDARHHMGHRS